MYGKKNSGINKIEIFYSPNKLIYINMNKPLPLSLNKHSFAFISSLCLPLRFKLLRLLLNKATPTVPTDPATSSVNQYACRLPD